MNRRMRPHRFPIMLVLLISLLLSACNGEAPRIAFTELDIGAADAGSGEKLFGQSNASAPACTACHAVADGSSSGIGNSLLGLANVAEARVAGQSAEEYLYWSILRPGQHLLAGYANLMYADYEDNLTAADLSDLIAYLLTL